MSRRISEFEKQNNIINSFKTTTRRKEESVFTQAMNFLKSPAAEDPGG
jgi:hypothetical protein